MISSSNLMSVFSSALSLDPWRVHIPGRGKLGGPYDGHVVGPLPLNEDIPLALLECRIVDKIVVFIEADKTRKPVVFYRFEGLDQSLGVQRLCLLCSDLKQIERIVGRECRVGGPNLVSLHELVEEGNGRR